MKHKRIRIDSGHTILYYVATYFFLSHILGDDINGSDEIETDRQTD